MIRLSINRFVSLLALPALTLALAWTAAAQPANSGKTTDAVLLTLKGKVEVARAAGGAWTPGQTNQTLKVGDRLRTGTYSQATVRLSNLSLLRVDELTTVEIEPPKETVSNPILNLKSGAVYFFNRDKPLETQFRTPAASGAIRGTEFNLAVGNDGGTTLALLDGQVSLANAEGSLDMKTGDQAVIEPGKAPRKTALIDAINIIQWTLYYPAILDPDELELNPQTKEILAESLQAYRSGDLPRALENLSVNRTPASDAERVYRAALALTVGQVGTAEELLKQGLKEPRPIALAGALQKMIAAVKHQTWTDSAPLTLASEWLAESYYQQSKSLLTKALEDAKQATVQSPNFAFALERLAELEFSFGHTSAALKALEKSLSIASRNAQALALKGFLLSAQNSLTLAADSFDQAIAADPALANGWLGRGLIRIKKNNVPEGRKDLEVAAALEPNRAVLRSYLGKAWSLNQPFCYTWNDQLATKELLLAQRLDPNDPTSWLYLALLDDQRNRINQAIAELEHSKELNNNRSVFRSKFLLDQDRAVRSANLAAIYRDDGLTDVSFREASQAIINDYGNFSAHLFLAESYDALRDPKKRNLRFETPWLNELLIANLLAPVGAGVFSQNVSQQEYSRLFESDRLGLSSQTEYFSGGDWVENASQFGTFSHLSYSANAYYRSEAGFRVNNALTDLDLNIQVKLQLAPKDTVFAEFEHSDFQSGDVSQYYSQTQANPNLRIKEKQDPNLLAGYHREWTPGSHTLFLLRRLDDDFSLNNHNTNVIKFLEHNLNVTHPLSLRALPVLVDRTNNMEAYSTELQQILQTESQTIVLGGRFQSGEIQTADAITPLDDNSFRDPGVKRHTADSDLWRASVYGYYQLAPIEELHLTAGLAYDRLHFPENIDLSPVNSLERDKDKVSPKFGIEWMPWENTRLHGAYTRSLGGVFNDANTRIEPSQVAGFNQTFRSLIPESVEGLVPGTEFETWHIGLDQKFQTRTYVAIEGELLNSHGDRFEGVFTDVGAPQVPDRVSSTRQTFDFREKTLALSVNQLIDDDWSVGARYRLSSANLNGRFTDIPEDLANAAGINQREESTLQQLFLYANCNLPCGFFSQFQSIWSSQFNRGFTPAEPGDEFWQFNIFGGYRFPRRHAEIRVGVLNLADRDYNLEPLTFYLELPHRRTFTASFKFDF